MKKKQVKPPPPVQQQKKQQQPQLPPQMLAGKGRYQFDSGNYYQGQWKLIDKKRMRQGYGQMMIVFPSSSYNQSYKGHWKNDKPDGEGQYCYISGAVYKGFWKNGQHHGYGVMHFPNGDIYQGQWEKQKMHGQGQLYDHQGNLTSGIWQNGSFNTKIQAQLKVQREINKKKQAILQRALKFFQKFHSNFQKSDKKTFKQNLNGFFISDQLKLYYKQPYIKFQTYQPQKWNDNFIYAKDKVHQSNVLHKNKVLLPQLNGAGQIVQLIIGKQGQRIIKIGLVQLANQQNFVLIYYVDTADQVKKK